MKRPSFRFGLRTLLVVTTLVAIGMAFWGNILYKDYKEKAAIESLRAAGAKIQKFEDHAVRVYLGGPTWDNEQVKLAIPHLKQLYKMRELDLVRVTLNDDGIAPLSELLGLQEIYVFETSLTEAGIKNLGESVLPGTKVNTTQPDPIASGMSGAIIYPHAIVGLAWSPDGKIFATGSGDGKVRFWNVDSFNPLAEWTAHEKWTFGIEFSPDGKLIATGGGDGIVRIWDAVTRHLVGQLKGHSDDIHSIAFTPDGDRLVSASDDRTIRVWDLETKETLRILTGHKAQIPSMDVSDDGKLIASASRDDTVRVWDLDSGAELAVLNPQAGDMLTVAFQHNGKLLAAGARDGTVRIWDQEDFQLLSTINGDNEPVYRVAFHPTINQLVVGGENGVQLVNFDQDNAERKSVPQKKVAQVAFRLDGKLLVSASAAGEIHLIHPATLESEKILRTAPGELGLDLGE